MAAAYDDYDYPKYWAERDYEHRSEVIALNSFFKKIGGNQKIIDIGGGYGRLAKEYAKFAKEVTLAEPSKKLIQRAKVFLRDSRHNIKYIESTVQNLPKKVKKNKYDTAVLVRVMHHIDNPEEAVEIVSGLVPKGGHFILEYANKLHGKALVRNLLNGNFTFPLDIFPIDKRSRKNIKKKSISFVNHHPDIIDDMLKEHNFKIIEKRSVSNIRSRKVKKLFPVNFLIFLEKAIQVPLAKYNFGPSIFILAKKK